MERSAVDEGSFLEMTPLMQKIAKILDDTRTSNATHNRKLKDIAALRSQPHFFLAFTRTLYPLFDFQRRSASSERVLRFVAVFSTSFPSNCDSFLENFFKFLIVATKAASRTARLRACQMMSEIILRLPDDAEVDDELWDEVIDSMMVRSKDKVPAIRMFAVRALSRFVSDPGNSEILDLFLEALPLEQNAEVRKTLVLALPASNLTSQVVIDYTLDVSESVRKAAYCVLANKFPLQSLSIKLRTSILQRGLADRSDAVVKECLKLLKEEWLSKSCKGNVVELLKYLDVETYEMVGESVMKVLLKAGAVQFNEVDGLQKYIISICEKAQDGDSPDCDPSVHLIDAEIAVYWRTICMHLQDEAQKKGSDAALTTGAEAAVYAAEASDSNDLLEEVLPATISDYVDLVRAHINAGPDYRFSSRQLLLLGTMLDFSDATNRKVASSFVQELLLKPLEHEADGEGNIIAVGDGINLGGDKEWASAVSALAKTVHSASGEFEEAVFRVIDELAQPCRERTADFLHWMHCLAVTGRMLENVKSLRWVQGKSMAANDLPQLLLLPGAKHVHSDVRRIAVRCLGLFGLLERKLSEELVTQLRQSYVEGPPPNSRVACMAIFDLLMWHGPRNIDRASGKDHAAQLQDDESAFQTVDLSDTDGVSEAKILDLLYAGLGREEWFQSLDCDESESVLTVLVEGLAKIMLLSDKYPSISASFHPLLLGKLICLYFSDQTKDLDRLRQCMSVFFEHYPSLSTNHKESLSRAFIPVMRSMWPGLDGTSGGSHVMVSNMRKRAVQASRFMLQMMQAPLYAKETTTDDSKESTEECAEESTTTVVWSQEGLAIRLATEVAGFSAKKTAAEKAYVAALCRILVLISYRSSKQNVIKLLRRLMYNVHECASSDKELVKELNRLAERLKSLDRNPDQQLLQGKADVILERLGLDAPAPPPSVPQTPVPPCSTRQPPRTRRQVRHETSSSDDEDGDGDEEASLVSVAPTTVSARSQRASKTAALSKIANGTRIPIKINEDEDEEEEEENSDMTSEEDSDGLD